MARRFICWGLLAVSCLAWGNARAQEASPTRGARIEAISGALKGGGENINYHALVIGINGYNEEAGWSPLAFPESDANRIVSLLKDSYDFKQVTYLSGAEATKEGVLSAVDRLKALTPSDSLFIFYAGHGYTLTEGEGKDGYWIPVDGTKDYATWVGMDHLHELMRTSRARHVLLVSDSCYAGAFFQRGFKIDDARARIENTIYEKQIEKPSRFVITSGNMEEVPDKSYFAESLIGLLEEESPPYVFSAEDLYYQLKRPVFRQTGTEVLGREMFDKEVGGNFVFIQRAPVPRETMLILQVHPPEAKVVVTGGKVIDHVSARVLDEQERKVGEHRIRLEPGVEYSVAITADGYHDHGLTFNGKPRQRRSQVVTMRPWVPRDFADAVLDDRLSFSAPPADESMLKQVYQETGTWQKGETTVTREANSARYFAVGTYMRSTNLQSQGGRGGRFGRTYAGVVLVCDRESKSQQDLYCYPPQPKEKDERSCRRIRDVLFLPRNERYVVVLTGDHLFLWDAEQNAMRKKLKLPSSMRSKEKGCLSYLERDGKSYVLIAGERTSNPGYEIVTE